jgi:hypothetical protein
MPLLAVLPVTFEEDEENWKTVSLSNNKRISMRQQALVLAMLLLCQVQSFLLLCPL